MATDNAYSGSMGTTTAAGLSELRGRHRWTTRRRQTPRTQRASLAWIKREPCGLRLKSLFLEHGFQQLTGISLGDAIREARDDCRQFNTIDRLREV